jgi:hypothetical protein
MLEFEISAAKSRRFSIETHHGKITIRQGWLDP